MTCVNNIKPQIPNSAYCPTDLGPQIPESPLAGIVKSIEHSAYIPTGVVSHDGKLIPFHPGGCTRLGCPTDKPDFGPTPVPVKDAPTAPGSDTGNDTSSGGVVDHDGDDIPFPPSGPHR